MSLITLFGSPVWSDHISPALYNKKELIDKMLKNYERSPIRNNWDTVSRLHHSLQDNNNFEYEEINYDKLINVYRNKIIKFFKETNLSCKFNFEIMNYTVVDSDGYLRPHEHFCDFTAIHYLSYDKENHLPLILHNDNPLNKHLKYQIIKNKINIDEDYNGVHSMFCSTWELPLKEDELYIMPGFLTHSVENNKKVNFQKTDKKRICIAFNIMVE